MSPFTVLVLCIQACLIQTTLGQALCGGSRILSLGRVSQPTVSVSQANSYQASSTASSGSYGSSLSSSSCGNSGGYGGQGTGQVGCAGNIDASGTTVVTGAVPVIGSVSFCGTAPASGSVSISGQCGCGCLS